MHIKQLEELLLKEMDVQIEKAESQSEKVIYGLFKTTILKKYKQMFDAELQQGRVHKKNVDKAIDFCFDDVCVAYRLSQGMSDAQKEEDLKLAKSHLPAIRQFIFDILVSRNVRIED